MSCNGQRMRDLTGGRQLVAVTLAVIDGQGIQREALAAGDRRRCIGIEAAAQ